MRIASSSASVSTVSNSREVVDGVPEGCFTGRLVRRDVTDGQRSIEGWQRLTGLPEVPDIGFVDDGRDGIAVVESVLDSVGAKKRREGTDIAPSFQAAR